MRTFLCLGCGEVFNESIANENNLIGYEAGGAQYACPRVTCHCVTVEVDDFLVSVIRNLNNLGMNTLACCSGHLSESMSENRGYIDTYIMMSREIWGEYIPDEVLEELSNSLPEGFSMSADYYGEPRFTIRKNVDCDDLGDAMMAIADNCASLYDWTNNELQGFIDHYFPEGPECYPLWVEDEDDETPLYCNCGRTSEGYYCEEDCSCDGVGSACVDCEEDCSGCLNSVDLDEV